MILNTNLTFLKSRTSFLSVTISRKFMIFLCFRFCRIFISLIAVMGNPPFSFSNRTFFNATRSPKSNQIQNVPSTPYLKFSVAKNVTFSYQCVYLWLCKPFRMILRQFSRSFQTRLTFVRTNFYNDSLH